MSQYRLVIRTNTSAEMHYVTGVHVTRNGGYISGSDRGLTSREQKNI